MRFRRLAELSLVEWLVLLQLTPIAAATKLALNHLPLQGTVERLQRIELPLFVRDLDEQRLYQLADWAIRLPARAKPCLLRSLMLHLMLQRRGEPSVVALGVTKSGASLQSHAWVTVRGRPMGESEAALARFTPIAQLGLT